MSVIKDSVALDPNSCQPGEESLQAQSPDKSQNVEEKQKVSNSSPCSNTSNNSVHLNASINSSHSGTLNNSVRSNTLTTRSNTTLVPARSNSIPTNSQSQRGSLKPNDQSMESGDAADSATQETKEDEQTTNENKAGTKVQLAQRSKSSITSHIVSLKSITKLFPEFNCDRLRMAREVTEKAIKMNKIFTIQGGYATVRNSLRKRGWVENFFRVTDTAKKHPPKKQSDVSNSDDDDDDDDDVGIDTEVDVPKVKPWEEEGGLYGIMSRMVRNLPPAFFWVLRRDIIDYRGLHKSQIVNHFARSAVFTTKVGLCVNLRNLQWFAETDPNTFFPRCYRLSHEEEKVDFIDDFNLTACMNILKIVVDNWITWSALSRDENQRDYMTPKTYPENMEGINDEGESEMLSSKFISEQNLKNKKSNGSSAKKPTTVPVLAVQQALRRCELFINNKENLDVDMDDQGLENLTPPQWEKLREYYYLLVHNKSGVIDLTTTLVNQCEACLKRLQILCPQFHLDGKNSVWIVKPGAKSRGRGITCYDRLEDILKLVENTVARRDSKYVIQKYIERPLLIYNCKFDIRQWFLITDWNPLTMYFYKDSYLRFCSQQFTLSKFDESIHLCNNAVQKNYKNGPRAKELPTSNMWTHHQFQEYLRNRNLSHIWDDVIYTGMKKAIISAMFVSQELVEPRKGSFELYGADFMLTDDYSPWLLEINSSPSMEASTEVTSRLCAKVLDDTLKVVIDRKYDKNCDIGRFEIGYKRSIVNNPPYICLNMSVEGQAIKKPFVTRRSIDLPQDSKENMLTTSQTAKRSNGQRSPPHMKKPNSNEGKEVLRENSKLTIPLCSNVFPSKKAVIPVTREVKSPTCLQVCYRYPDDTSGPQAEKLWLHKALEINCIRKDNYGYGWIIDRDEDTKKNKKFDPKILKGNKIIRNPNGTYHTPRNYQVPYLDSRKWKTNIKNFRERPKKALVTPIARIKFPLLTLQVAKQPYTWRCSQKKNIPAGQHIL